MKPRSSSSPFIGGLPEGSLELALDMSAAARDLALAGLRERYPGWSRRELERELIRYGCLPDPMPVPAP